ncbi:MAG TPA: hypothetical protein VHX14_20975 [Thermoanaerobaculia bacterium]|jgi:hypothetical protein|nr:hypothetical protein [Thermoanaerobaculia bacterium]
MTANTNIRRDLLVRLAAAMWGFAIAISLLPLWFGPPYPGQLPGFAKMIGFDARAPMRFALGLMLIPLLWTLALRPILTLLASNDTRGWARNAFASASAAILWFVIIDRNLVWVLIAPAIVLAVSLTMRKADARFSRHDLILLPVLATIYLALLDFVPRSVEQLFVIALMTVFLVRIAIVPIRRTSGLPPALCFALAPLGLALQSSFNAYDVRHSPWGPLILAIITPLLLRAFVSDTPATRSRFRVALRYAIFPLAAYAYLSATSSLAAEGMPRADLFEDQQHLMPAAEMLRGEKPYRDIIPAHGFGQDALLDYAALRTGPVTLGHVLKFRGIVSGTIVIAHYALVAAVTGSPEVGLASTFLAMLFGTAGGSFRVLPAIATLAFVAYAIRRRDPRWLAVAGAGAVVCIGNSLEQGAYLLLVLAITSLRFRRDRMRALKFTAIGGGSAAIIAFIAMAIYGIAGDFVRVTIFEIATLGPVYTLTPYDAPPALQHINNIPEVLGALLDKSSWQYVMWPVMMLFVVLALTTRTSATPRRRANREAFLIVAIYGVLTAVSYAERHHLLWQFVAAPLMTTAIFRLFRSRVPTMRIFAPALLVLVLMIAQPTAHIAIAGALRHARGSIDSGWQELALPRARGAFSKATDAAVIDIVQRYSASHLKPGETWFDFTNRGNLYFLLDRDCPMRQLEVAFYETEELQRDVIHRIEANPRIRFAIIPPYPDDNTAVDNVANRDRAPLVYAYLQQHFTPDYEEGGVIFWRRK